MSKQKLTKADLKRMEDLSKKIAADKKAVAIEKNKVNKMKKEVEAEKKKLANDRKEFKNLKKKAQDEKAFRAGVADKNAKKAAKASANGGNTKQLQAQLLEMKTKYNAEGKRARNFQQERDQLAAENKVLQKKLKNLQGRKGKGEDPRIRHLLRENRMLKKQIKLLMIELNKKRRWFQRCIKSFRKNRSKWIKTQEDALKKKGVLIKYVFLDDVKQIKTFKDPKKSAKSKGNKLKFKNKIKVKSRDGGVIVLKDVEIVVLDNDDDSDSGKNKKGKGAKSKGDQMDEMEDFMESIQKEIEAEQAELGGNMDDHKSDDEDDEDFNFDDDDIGDLDGDVNMDELTKSAKAATKAEDADNGNNDNGDDSDGHKALELDTKSIASDDKRALQAQLVYLMKELDDRTDDLEKLKSIISDGATYPDPRSEVKQYVLQINKRGEEMVDKFDNDLHSDNVDQIKKNNERWSLWLNNLSLGMAKNGDLLNQLMDVYEYYLKELKGRISDLMSVNDAYYTNKGESADGVGQFAKLKEVVVERHNEVEGVFVQIEEKEATVSEEDEQAQIDNYGAEDKEQEKLDANKEKVKLIRDSLKLNNKDWRELIDNVSGDYNEMTGAKVKFVIELNQSTDELKTLLDLVCKIPKRKILEADDDNNNDANGNSSENEEVEADAYDNEEKSEEEVDGDDDNNKETEAVDDEEEENADNANENEDED